MPTKGADRLREHRAQLNNHIITDNDLMALWRDDALQFAVISQEESARLCQLAQAGDTAARNACVEGSIRLVPYVIHRYKFDSYGLPMPDLIQEGSIGLMLAVKGYRADAGVRFTTYATRCIWSHLMRATHQDTVIHVPEHTRIRLAAQAKGRPLKHHPTISADIPAAAKRAQHVASLDETIYEDHDGDNVTVGEALTDPDADTEGDAVDRTARSELLALLEAILTRREVQVITLCYGLDAGGYAREATEVAQMLGGISRERVRQLRNKALEKLRAKLMQDADGSVRLKRALVEMLSNQAAA